MLPTFADAITPDEQHAILARVAAAEFVDGRETAGANLADRKHNEQIPRADVARLQAINAIVLEALKRNDAFRNGCIRCWCRAIGFVDELADVRQVDARALKWLQELLKLPAQAMSTTRLLARADMFDIFSDPSRLSVEEFTEGWFGAGPRPC